MKEKGFLFINSLFLLLFVLILFYLLGFFISFSIKDIDGATLTLLEVILVLTFFSLGIIASSVNPLLINSDILQYVSSFCALLSFPIIVSSVGGSSFKVVAFIIIPLSVFHFFILSVFLAQRKKNKKTSKARKENKGPLSNKRIHKRFKGDVYAEYSLDGNNWHQKVGVYDTSVSGIRLIIDEKLNVGKEMDLKIYVPKDNRPIFIKGLIVWAQEFLLGKKVYHIGVKFLKIDSSDSLRLGFREVYNILQNEKGFI